ncbi:XdhC family protein [Acetobacter sp. TBRC 12305]|uniref:XdhC family protein n=1 Tax=Acetobacter garciniae TaxID=2817435 RepID=A0A939KN58_9PROT|nr:XdhC/CoxI family protein [Acetobacter garciniae]MBO1326018.1 XdhC family protein [Acetobacter garciniae]MBX0345238.1 XdhC family protein [Acetobacter garciniae]
MTLPAPGHLLPATPLDHALAWIGQGQPVAIATVTGAWGSSPRPAGSCMVIAGNGRVEGSVSGGCVESDVMVQAQDILAGAAPMLLHYGVSSARAWEVGLACGGKLDVLVEAVRSPACPTGTLPLSLLEEACADVAARRSTALARTLDGTRHCLLHPSTPAVGRPHPAAGKADTRTADAPPEPCPAPVMAAAAHCLADGRATTTADDSGQDWFVQPLTPPPRLLIVGAVHVAQHLAQMAALTGLAPVVIDPREALATQERFTGLVPGQTLITDWPTEALEALKVDAMTAIATLTHDAKLDDPTLEAALASPAFYIGALGSRRTQASRLERLRELGFDEQALRRIRGPIGLAIGAVGAEEIALSILAEIVAVRRNAPLAAQPGW